MGKTKMRDIARKAGVSLATVGRVINQNGYVSADKRKEIEQIIAETGYVPNKIAQGLKSSQSKLIGHLTLFNPNMLYEQITEALNKSANRHGYQVLTLTSLREKDDERRQVEELIGHQVDGVIITSNPYIDASLIEKFTKARIPVVMIERTQSLPSVDSVQVDDHQGAYDAVSHILAKGHRRIGFIGMKIWHDVERQRYEGYCQALQDAGLVVDPSQVCLTESYQVAEGQAAASHLMQQPEAPTAIFMTSDIFACGVLQYCYTQGIRVSDQLSLVGYDNTLSALVAPPISSMGLPNDQIGEQAITLLLHRMKDLEQPSQSAQVRPILVDRETVRAVN